ncbi:MAG: hypothetical protein DPW14_17370 [Planctomycetes bacterium]|nr:hypothetical protein [Planctomycetota bacterium]
MNAPEFQATQKGIRAQAKACTELSAFGAENEGLWLKQAACSPVGTLPRIGDAQISVSNSAQPAK